jgi:hypothetical protein
MLRRFRIDWYRRFGFCLSPYSWQKSKSHGKEVPVIKGREAKEWASRRTNEIDQSRFLSALLISPIFPLQIRFCTEDGYSRFLRIVDKCVPDYIAAHLTASAVRTYLTRYCKSVSCVLRTAAGSCSQELIFRSRL